MFPALLWRVCSSFFHVLIYISSVFPSVWSTSCISPVSWDLSRPPFVFCPFVSPYFRTLDCFWFRFLPVSFICFHYSLILLLCPEILNNCFLEMCYILFACYNRQENDVVKSPLLSNEQSRHEKKKENSSLLRSWSPNTVEPLAWTVTDRFKMINWTH